MVTRFVSVLRSDLSITALKRKGHVPIREVGVIVCVYYNSLTCLVASSIDDHGIQEVKMVRAEGCQNTLF